MKLGAECTANTGASSLDDTSRKFGVYRRKQVTLHPADMHAGKHVDDEVLATTRAGDVASAAEWTCTVAESALAVLTTFMSGLDEAVTACTLRHDAAQCGKQGDDCTQ